MQQYFIKGQVENPVTIKDKDTVKHRGRGRTCRFPTCRQPAG